MKQLITSKPSDKLCYWIFSFICMFCRSLFVLLCFFFWSLCCLFFFNLRILITLWYLQTLLTYQTGLIYYVSRSCLHDTPVKQSLVLCDLHSPFHMNKTCIKRQPGLFYPHFNVPFEFHMKQV